MEENTGTEVAETTEEVAEQPAEDQAQQTQESEQADPAQSAKKGSLKESVKEQVRKFKLKISGRQREVDEKTLIALAQKGQAADEKFQKTAAQKRKIEQLYNLAKKDPDAFIKQVLGEDSVEFSKKRLARQLEELSLDPKEKQLRDMKRRIADYEQKERLKAEQTQKEADSKAVEHWTKHYDTVLPKAITDAGLPLTEDVIRHATDIMIANLEEGFDLPMEAVMQLTRDRYVGSVKKFLGAADSKKLVQLLGEQVAAKLGAVTKKPTTRKPSVQQDGARQQANLKTEQERMADLDKRLQEWAKS